MNKLTKDLNTPHDDTTYANVVIDAVDRENIVLTKLKHYEDIEEEIGIDLEILYKALKSESIWIQKHIGAGKFRIVEVNIRGLNINKYTNEITIRDENNSLHILNGYGKMWALTREELEEAI